MRAAEIDEPRAADPVEWERVGKDVARALERRADHGPDREGGGCGPGDPADRRPAGEVRLDEPEVRPGPGRDAHNEAHQQRA